MKPTSNNANSITLAPRRKEERSDLPKASYTKQKGSRKDEKDIKKELRETRVEHLKEIRELKASFKNELGLVKKKFDAQIRSEKDSNQRVYERQRLELQKDQEKILKDQLREVIQNYSNLTSSYQKELEKIRKVQYEHDDIMREKDAEIVRMKLELVKSQSDLQTRRMIMQLAERNAMIERLHSRIEELEDLDPQRRGPAEEEAERGRAVAGDDFDDERMHEILVGKQQTRGKMYETLANPGSDLLNETSYQPNGMTTLDDDGQGENEGPSYEVDSGIETR
jgi:HrpA-like RNA helicase